MEVKIFVGFMLGIIGGIGLALITLANEIKVVRSYKKITPEMRLVTDGKKIDTLYIYKTN